MPRPFSSLVFLGFLSVSGAAYASKPTRVDTLEPVGLVATDGGFVSMWRYVRTDGTAELRARRFGPSGAPLAETERPALARAPERIYGFGSRLLVVSGSRLVLVSASTFQEERSVDLAGPIADVVRGASGGIDAVSVVDESTLGFARFTAELVPIGEATQAKKSARATVVGGGAGHFTTAEARSPDPSRRSTSVVLSRYASDGTLLVGEKTAYVTDEDAYTSRMHLLSRADGDLFLVPWNTLTGPLTHKLDVVRFGADGTIESMAPPPAWRAVASSTGVTAGSRDGFVAWFTEQKILQSNEDTERQGEEPARGTFVWYEPSVRERRRVEFDLPPLGTIASAACNADGCLAMTTFSVERHELAVRFVSLSGGASAPMLLDATPSLEASGCSVAGADGGESWGFGGFIIAMGAFVRGIAARLSRRG